MNIVTRKISDLIPYINNARTHDDIQVSQVVSSIKEFGFTNPVLIDKEDGIIAGHARVMAAIKLNLKEVPCIVLDKLSEAQKKAYIIADNKLSLNAGWNEELLNLEIEALQDLNFDINLIGFEENELDDIIEGTDPIKKGLTEQNDAPEIKEEVITNNGDVWQLGEHRLLCGDATSREEVCGYIKEERAEMMFTDPPYGMNYKSERRGVIMGDQSQATIPVSFGVSVEHVLSENARIYVCGGSCNVQMHYHLFDFHLNMLPQMIIWMKENILVRNNNYHSQYEIIFFGWKGRGGTNEYWHGERTADNCSDVFQIHRDLYKDYVHPTQKPVELSLRCITNSSKAGDIVYDPFGGSGSTLIACEKSGRHCRMIEIDPRFCDVIIRRWQEFTGKEAIHEATGKTFQELEETRLKDASW